MIDILKEVGQAAVLEQLTEECCELGQAALKLARKLRGENPTPDDKEAIVAHLNEEVMDVLVVLYVLGGISGAPEVANSPKLKRWIERIEAAKNGQD